MARKFMFVCLGILALAVTFHVGAEYGHANLQGMDIALGTGMLQNGQKIPLPYYPDGTQAMQDECVWMAMPRHLHTGHNSTLGFDCVAKSDRVIKMKQYTIEGQYYDSHVTYLIIGVRGGSVATKPATWGQIKAEFGE